MVSKNAGRSSFRLRRRFWPVSVPWRLGARYSSNFAYLDHVHSSSSFVLEYPLVRPSDLDELFEGYGSDKGGKSNIFSQEHPTHSYSVFYANEFAPRRDSITALLEIGIGREASLGGTMGEHYRSGASLRAWREYFPNAVVYGGDIQREVLFTEDRIRTDYLDQLSHSSCAVFAEEVELPALDLIVDDGLHTFEAGVSALEFFWTHLKVGGTYIIEDVTGGSLRQFHHYFLSHNLPGKAAVSFLHFFRPDRDLSDDSLVCLRKIASTHDERAIREVIR